MQRRLTLAVITSALVLLIGCGEPATKPSSTIVYTVTGTDGVTKAFLTYDNEQDGHEQTDADLPWTKTFTAPSHQPIYISAQNRGNTRNSRINGGVTCDITVNGKPFKHSQSHGDFSIATCNGATP